LPYHAATAHLKFNKIFYENKALTKKCIENKTIEFNFLEISCIKAGVQKLFN
jgi:hypothetical protein